MALTTNLFNAKYTLSGYGLNGSGMELDTIAAVVIGGTLLTGGVGNLFGTVLGIIEAFSALSTEQTGSGAVMASIAKALIATAAGLFVAIPAVVAYNVFAARLKAVIARCDALKNLYLSRLKE